MSETTMTKYLSVLSRTDKAIICNAVRAHSEFTDAHPGLLPFLSLKMVLGCLGKVTPKRRQHRELVSTLGQDPCVAKDQISFVMYLNDAKVYKLFGPKPERGHALPCLPKKRVTVGMRWSLPRKCYEPDDDVLVKPMVALERKCNSANTKYSTTHWLVSCERKYRAAVAAWMVDNLI